MGDLNARTGKYSDSVCKEGNNLITNDQSEFSLCPTQRNSFDNLLNSQDKRLLEIFKNADLRILNGRVSGGSLGRVTFHGKNGVSAVDYAVCDQDLLSHIPNFVVKDPLHLSDHSAITTRLNINKKTSYNHTILEGDTLTRLPKQFLWENDSAQKFKDVLRSPRIQTLICDYIAGDTFNENTELSLEKVENILITTAKCCLKIRAAKTRKRIKSLSNKKRFDKECRLKRHELRKLANKKHQDPLNTTIREQYHDTLAQYKKLLNSKKNDYYNAKISELEKTGDNSDAKTFWQCLKSTDDTRKGEDVPSISEENWLQYFHNLHSNEPLNPAQQNICNELRQNECHGQHSRPLDFLTTEREIRNAAEKLKNNKSPFSDKIRNEVIKASTDTLMPVYEKLFN